MIQNLNRKCSSKYGLDGVTISCTTRVLALLKNELQNLTIDGLWFMRCGIHKFYAVSVELREGGRISMSPDLALRYGHTNTSWSTLVFMTFEQSCETRGDEIIDALQQTVSGQIFSTLLVQQNDPLLTHQN